MHKRECGRAADAAAVSMLNKRAVGVGDYKNEFEVTFSLQGIQLSERKS